MSISKDNSERQSTVTREGTEFEQHVKAYVNGVFKSATVPLLILDKNEVFGDEKLRALFSIPISDTKKVWGDLDLLAIDVNSGFPIAVISCKLSLHGRFSETLFYALVFKKLAPKTKVVFATPDKGRQSKEKVWASEWGSADVPTRDRDFGEYFVDGVYIDNIYLKKKWGMDGKTKLSGKIKDISELPNDIIKWSKEVR